MPIDAQTSIREVSRRRLFAKTKTFKIFWRMFSSLLHKLDMEYWTLHTGTDGYLYLLFQRRLLNLTLVLTGISMVISFAVNSYINQKQNWGLEIFFHRFTLENKQFDS